MVPVAVTTSLIYQAARQVAAAGDGAQTAALPLPGLAQHSILLRKAPH